MIRFKESDEQIALAPVNGSVTIEDLNFGFQINSTLQLIDVNLKGTLYGIAAALPGFLEQGSGHIINLSSVAGIKVFAPGGTVYSGTKFAVSAISEGLRHEVGEKVRVTSIEPGAVESDLKFTTSGTAAETVLDFYKQAIPAASVARAIAFAVEQPDDVDVNAIVIRPTAQEF